MGVNVLTDYGAQYMLNTVFETATDFRLVLLQSHGLGATQAAVDDTPLVEEITPGSYGYARKTLRGSVGGAFEWQTTAGAAGVEGDIAAYSWAADSAAAALSWVFTGPITAGTLLPAPNNTERGVVGYAVILPTYAAGTTAFTQSQIMFAQVFDYPFIPRTNGDTLTIDKISFRLTKFTGGATFV
jgi:hypothetical protein